MDRIPTEILSYILGFSIQESPPFCSKHGHRKEELAAVSRTWREIILNTPRFWCIINISNRWPLSSVKQHVERSRGHLLDIVIRSCEKENFVKRLDVVIPHIQRWRTLIVSCQDDDKVLSLLLRKLGNSTLPHLVHVEVWESENAPMRFLRPKNTPALERLQLDGLPRDCFPSHGKRRAQARPTLPSQLLSQRLTALSLLIDTPNISLQPNSIILPLLTSLSLRVATPRKLMEAIVAPKLVSFCIKRNVSNIKLSTVFNDLGDKYNGVQNLALCGPFHEQKLEDAKAVCLTFPKVQNVEIAIEEIPIFCGKDQNNMFPADHWDQLQCLVVNFYGYYEVPYGGELESWLQRRSDQNRSKLRVVLMDFPEGHNMEFEDTIHSMLPYLLDAVKELCMLEFINAPLGHGVGLTVHKNFPLQVNLSTLKFSTLATYAPKVYRAECIAQECCENCEEMVQDLQCKHLGIGMYGICAICKWF